MGRGNGPEIDRKELQWDTFLFGVFSWETLNEKSLPKLAEFIV